jgi:hypothetical protein
MAGRFTGAIGILVALLRLAQQRIAVKDNRSEELLCAIETLINVKLIDAMARPDGFARLVGHRTSGVASYPIRCAERDLEKMIRQCLMQSSEAGH